MKKASVFVSIFPLLALSLGFGQTSSKTLPVRSAWGSEAEEDGVKFTQILSFSHNDTQNTDEMEKGVTCVDQKTWARANARVSMPIEIAFGRIKVTQAASSTTTQPLTCTAEIAAGSLTYVFSPDGNQLQLSDDKGTVMLSRVLPVQSLWGSETEQGAERHWQFLWFSHDDTQNRDEMQKEVRCFDHEERWQNPRERHIEPPRWHMAESSVTVPIEITVGRIEVTTAASRTIEEEDSRGLFALNCTAQIAAGSLPYVFSPDGNHLQLSDDKGAVTFVRLKTLVVHPMGPQEIKASSPPFVPDKGKYFLLYDRLSDPLRQTPAGPAKPKN